MPPPKKESTSVSPARAAAYDILLRVNDGGYSANLLASIPESALSRTDRGLTHEIVLGVLRWQKLLDYYIERYSKRRVSALDLPVVIALRMGLYQLMKLTRVPARAAVTESVNMVKRARVSSAAPMVNAVLRSAARNLNDHPDTTISDPLERLAVEQSHPRWMLERWERELGRWRASGLSAANNEPSAVVFRINPLRGSQTDALDMLASEGVEVSSSVLAPGAFVVKAGGGVAASQAARSGRIYLQSEASQLAGLLLDARPGQAVLDLCAAPGSKTTHIAALTLNRSDIVACDIHPRRLAALTANCERLGVTSVNAVAADVTDPPFVEGFQKFDRVLVDAPCSGTGTLRENPEIKWRLDQAALGSLAELQLRLLQSGARALAAGGKLVYSTCSMEPEENEDVVGRFLAGSTDFHVLNAEAEIRKLARAASNSVRAGPEAHSASEVAMWEPLVRTAGEGSLTTREGYLRTYPDIDLTDGFFVALLEKN
jgi:16S rRNA (cytosine967-C5)-methyltransferase